MNMPAQLGLRSRLLRLLHAQSAGRTQPGAMLRGISVQHVIVLGMLIGFPASTKSQASPSMEQRKTDQASCWTQKARTESENARLQSRHGQHAQTCQTHNQAAAVRAVQVRGCCCPVQAVLQARTRHHQAPATVTAHRAQVLHNQARAVVLHRHQVNQAAAQRHCSRAHQNHRRIAPVARHQALNRAHQNHQKHKGGW